MGNYRDRLDIIADILHVVSEDAKKTQIMYKANLSYKVLQRYLGEVLGASLVRFESTGQFYVLTPKGQQFLEAYKGYSRVNKTLEKRFNDVCTQKKMLEGLCSDV